MMQELQNQQAASMIQASQGLAQMMSEEMAAMKNAAHERDLRQEKLMQMILQSKEQKSAETSSTPAMGSTETVAPRLCQCGKPAEMLQVKDENNPRKGKKFWKCVLRECKFFEWDQQPINKAPMDAVSVASSHNPRMSKSPRRAPTESGSVPVGGHGARPRRSQGQGVAHTKRAAHGRLGRTQGDMLQRRQRRSLNQAMIKWEHKNKSKDLVEVYSPPRVGKEAERRGLSAGSSIDLVTG